MSLSRAHDLLLSDDWAASTVAQIVEGALGALGLPLQRVNLEGCEMHLAPQPALHLALALHELATNAVKHGALANDSGRVTFAWGLAGPQDQLTADFTWCERGGPPVRAPRRRGFGTRLLTRLTEAAFKGQVELDYDPAGFRWRLTAPYAPIAEGQLSSGRSA